MYVKLLFRSRFGQAGKAFVLSVHPYRQRDRKSTNRKRRIVLKADLMSTHAYNSWHTLPAKKAHKRTNKIKDKLITNTSDSFFRV